MLTRIFLDTEFTNLENPTLISIGLTSETGEHFYMECKDFPLQECSNFSKQRVIPLLLPLEQRYSNHQIKLQLSQWFKQFSDVIIFVDNGIDIKLFVQLLENIPKNIVHAYNISEYISHTSKVLWFNTYPNYFEKCAITITNLFFSRVQQYYSINNEVSHYALNDSKANCFAFLDIEQYFHYSVSKILNQQIDF